MFTGQTIPNTQCTNQLTSGCPEQSQASQTYAKVCLKESELRREGKCPPTDFYTLDLLGGNTNEYPLSIMSARNGKFEDQSFFKHAFLFRKDDDHGARSCLDGKENRSFKFQKYK